MRVYWKNQGSNERSLIREMYREQSKWRHDSKFSRIYLEYFLVDEIWVNRLPVWNSFRSIGDDVCFSCRQPVGIPKGDEVSCCDKNAGLRGRGKESEWKRNRGDCRRGMSKKETNVLFRNVCCVSFVERSWNDRIRSKVKYWKFLSFPIIR